MSEIQFSYQDTMEGDTQHTSTSLHKTDWKSLNEEIRDKMKTEFLLESLRTREKWLLEKAIEVAKEPPAIAEDDPVLKEAEIELEIVRLKEDLRNAQGERDPELIKAVIRRIPTSETYMRRLQQDVALAHSDLARYERMIILRRSILDMDMRMMSEMRRYHKPPTMVHDIMKAIMLFFGEHEDTTQDWRIVQKQLNPHGQTGMNRKVLNFDASSVHPAICARIRQILEGITLAKLQMVSPGAATFYVWAMGVVEMIEHQKGNETPANVWKQKEIFGCLVNNPNSSPKNKRRYLQRNRPHWQK